MKFQPWKLWAFGLVFLMWGISLPTVAAPKAKSPVVQSLPDGVIQDCENCPLLNLIPAGRFVLGSPASAREADVTTGETGVVSIVIEKAFAMGRYEVTRAEYQAFVSATNRLSIGDCRVATANGFVRKSEASWETPGFNEPPTVNDPVVCVSWDDAHAYTDWLSQKTGHRYRLASETEWEYAARSGTSGARFFSAEDSDEWSLVSRACEYANVYDFSAYQFYHASIPHARCTDGAVGVVSVGHYKPNGFDLYDMLGNAREWLEDCYTASYVGRPTTGQEWVWGGCPQRVVRGGSFASRPAEARSAFRGHELQSFRQNDLGFRVVRELD